MSWDECNLGELIHIKHGYAFKSEYFASKGKQIVLTPGNFYEDGGFKLRDNRDRFYTGDYPSEYLLHKGNIIVAMTEQGAGLLGSSALIPEDDKYLHNQRLGLVKIKDQSRANPFYLYKIFNTQDIRHQISSSASGVKVRHTSPDRIYKCRINLPPLPIQKKIATILSAYDDLIENNLMRMKLLEEMAQITYEEWFVRLRFPGHENTSINPDTGLPGEWKRLKLGDTCKLTMGQSPKSVFYNLKGEGLPFHQGVKDYGERFPTNACWSTNGTRYAERGDILFSVRAPVGRLNIAMEKMILGRGLAAIHHKKDAQGFLYCLLKKQFFEEDMMGGGAIFNSVTKNDMLRIETVEPDNQTLERFNSLVTTTDREIENLHEQNIFLREARDILLPRLMTGMIDVEQYNPADLLKEVA